MYHINNNVFSCVLKVVRLQSDIRNIMNQIDPPPSKTAISNQYSFIASQQ